MCTDIMKCDSDLYNKDCPNSSVQLVKFINDKTATQNQPKNANNGF